MGKCKCCKQEVPEKQKAIKLTNPQRYWAIYVHSEKIPIIHIYKRNSFDRITDEEELSQIWYFHVYSPQNRHHICFMPDSPDIHSMEIVIPLSGWVTVSTRLD